jgi:hypothetical protein
MRIVNTFISDTPIIPEYTRISLGQARKLNPDIPIDFICLEKQEFFDELNINWISQTDLSDGQMIIEFNNISPFKKIEVAKTKHKSPELFWHRTAERIFYIGEYMNRAKTKDVYHFENDVLIYYALELADKSANILITPQTEREATFSFCYFPNAKKIFKLCNYFNELLTDKDSELYNSGYGFISEMSMLSLALKNNIVESFPTIKSDEKFIYDPGSYGQYLGGTNLNHPAGFTDPFHIIGKKIQDQEIQVTFDTVPKTNNNLIFNLHVHSKELNGFVLQ